MFQMRDVRRAVAAGNGQFRLGQLRPAAQVLQHLAESGERGLVYGSKARHATSFAGQSSERMATASFRTNGFYSLGNSLAIFVKFGNAEPAIVIPVRPAG